MTGTTVTAPTWVVGPAASVVDLMWLAYDAWSQSRSPRTGGMATAAAWVLGLRVAPMTARAELPVSHGLAESECVAAQLVVDAAAGMPRFPAETYCARWDVEFVPASPDVGVEWADGVFATLRWLIGRPTAAGRAGAPMNLPARGGDGALLSADELYARSVAAHPLTPLPEERARLRIRASVDEARSKRLVAAIQSIQDAAQRG